MGDIPYVELVSVRGDEEVRGHGAIGAVSLSSRRADGEAPLSRKVTDVALPRRGVGHYKMYCAGWGDSYAQGRERTGPCWIGTRQRDEFGRLVNCGDETHDTSEQDPQPTIE